MQINPTPPTQQHHAEGQQGLLVISVVSWDSPPSEGSNKSGVKFTEASDCVTNAVLHSRPKMRGTGGYVKWESTVVMNSGDGSRDTRLMTQCDVRSGVWQTLSWRPSWDMHLLPRAITEKGFVYLQGSAQKINIYFVSLYSLIAAMSPRDLHFMRPMENHFIRKTFRSRIWSSLCASVILRLIPSSGNFHLSSYIYVQTIKLPEQYILGRDAV
jgi:hypothetical protein